MNYEIGKLKLNFFRMGVIKKSIFKIVVLALIVTLNWSGLSAVGRTFAYFNDTEQSPGNTYSAGSLDFSLRSGQSNFVPEEKVSNMAPGDSVARDIYIKKEGTLPFKYTAHSEPVDGDCNLELYNALRLKIYYNWYDATPTEPNYHEHRHMDLKYDGLLKDFDLRALNPDDPDLQIPNSHPYFENRFYGPDEHWFYATEVILPADVSAELQNKSCKFSFVFDGWQTNLPDGSTGFSDTESMASVITTGNWEPQVQVIVPNGGQKWYMVPDNCADIPLCQSFCLDHGMNDQCQYALQWTAHNPIGNDGDLSIDIFYSVDSGDNWLAQIASHIDNSGIYWWKIPYDSSYISEKGRIKVKAINKTYSFLFANDMSDSDFCPPMLSMNDIYNLEKVDKKTADDKPSADSGGDDNLFEIGPYQESGSGGQEEALQTDSPSTNPPKDPSATDVLGTDSDNPGAVNSGQDKETGDEETDDNQEFGSEPEQTSDSDQSVLTTDSPPETTTNPGDSNDSSIKTDSPGKKDILAGGDGEDLEKANSGNEEKVGGEPVTDDSSGSDMNSGSPDSDSGEIDTEEPTNTDNNSGNLNDPAEAGTIQEPEQPAVEQEPSAIPNDDNKIEESTSAASAGDGDNSGGDDNNNDGVSSANGETGNDISK